MDKMAKQAKLVSKAVNIIQKHFGVFASNKPTRAAALEIIKEVSRGTTHDTKHGTSTANSKGNGDRGRDSSARNGLPEGGSKRLGN